MRIATLTCAGCSKSFDRPWYWQNRVNKSGQTNNYCCRQCQPRKRALRQKCINCGVLTTNAKYCSRSCSNKKLADKHISRYKLQGKCQKCDTDIHSTRIYCDSCRTNRKDAGDATLAESKKYGSNMYHVQVRMLARRTAEKAGLLKSCKICGYSNIVECCHIKPVNEFSEDTKLSVVNSLDNLIGLCPNHHKELDKGILKLKNY
jgi:hypothetical protein